MATSSEFSSACWNAGRIATWVRLPAPTTAYRTRLDVSCCAIVHLPS